LFVVHITDEFILGLDVMYAHDASVDLRCHELRLEDDEMPFRYPGATAVATQCNRVARMLLERLLKAVDRVVGTGSKADHQAEAKTLSYLKRYKMARFAKAY
jgi:hypothetical protein